MQKDQRFSTVFSDETPKLYLLPQTPPKTTYDQNLMLINQVELQKKKEKQTKRYSKNYHSIKINNVDSKGSITTKSSINAQVLSPMFVQNIQVKWNISKHS